MYSHLGPRLSQSDFRGAQPEAPFSNGITSAGAGSIIQITPSGSVTLLYSFNCGGYGGCHGSNLVDAPDGTLYGTTAADSDDGDVFKLSGAVAAPPAPPVLLDAVPLNPGDGTSLLPGLGSAVIDAATGAGPTRLASEAVSGGTVKGVAANGVAELVIAIPSQAVGERFTLALSSDATTCPSMTANECGLSFDPTNPGSTAQPVSVTSVSTSNGPMAFAVYRAPADFVRSSMASADQSAASRGVSVVITSTDLTWACELSALAGKRNMPARSRLDLAAPGLPGFGRIWRGSSRALTTARSARRFSTDNRRRP